MLAIGATHKHQIYRAALAQTRLRRLGSGTREPPADHWRPVCGPSTPHSAALISRMRITTALAFALVAPILGLMATATVATLTDAPAFCRGVSLGICERDIHAECILVRRIVAARTVWSDAPVWMQRVCIEDCRHRSLWP